MLKRHFWSFVDPLLLKVASRLDHLKRLQPHDYSENWNLIAKFDNSVWFHPRANLDNKGQATDLTIGSFSHIQGNLRIVAPGGILQLGQHCFVGENSNIWAQKKIEIGNFVLISHLVDIHDTDSHTLNAADRRLDPINLFERKREINWAMVEAKPIRIEDDVWIGFKASIMKGVTIGKGAVVASGSRVSNDIPPYALVAGNPARIIKVLESA